MTNIDSRTDKPEEPALYRTLVDNALDPIISVDQDFRITLWNQASEAMLGYSLREALSEDISNLIFPEEFRPTFNRMMECLTRPEKYEAEVRPIFEIVVRNRNGDLFPVEASLFQAGSKDVPEYTIILRNISTRKQLEDELREKSDELEDFLESTTEKLTEALEREQLSREITQNVQDETDLDRIIQLAVDGIGQLTSADRCVFWEYSPNLGSFKPPRHEYRSDESISSLMRLDINEMPVFSNNLNSFKPVVIPDALLADDITELDRMLIEQRKIKSLLHVPVRYHNEFLGVLRVHSIKENRDWDDETLDSLKNVAAIIAIAIQNAKSREEIEQAYDKLKESEERYSLVFEATNDGIWDWDLETNEVYINQRYEEMLGIKAHESVTTLETILGLFHPDDIGRIRENMPKFINDSSLLIVDDDFRIVRPDGEIRYLTARAKKIQTEGKKLKRILGIVRDVTEERLHTPS